MVCQICEDLPAYRRADIYNARARSDEQPNIINRGRSHGIYGHKQDTGETSMYTPG